MNQKQRDFLIEQVDVTWRNQRDLIEKDRPREPNLNNHLVAAFLDDSIEFADITELKKSIRERVLKMGTSDVLVYTDSSYRNTRNDQYVKLKPEELFIIPEGYQKAYEEFKTKEAEVNKKLQDLAAQRQTVIMKIQIGSAQVLDKLVQQVDSIGDLDLMNNQLKLTE